MSLLKEIDDLKRSVGRTLCELQARHAALFEALEEVRDNPLHPHHEYAVAIQGRIARTHASIEDWLVSLLDEAFLEEWATNITWGRSVDRLIEVERKAAQDRWWNSLTTMQRQKHESEVRSAVVMLDGLVKRDVQ